MPVLHIAASDVQLQMQFSKPLPTDFSWVTSQKLAFSRLQPLTASLPSSLVGNPDSPKETDFHWWSTKSIGRSGSSLLVETRVPSHAFKVLADNSHLGHWSPGFWCCSSWCQSLDLFPFQQHQHLPLPKMLCGRGTALILSRWGGYLKI